MEQRYQILKDLNLSNREKARDLQSVVDARHQEARKMSKDEGISEDVTKKLSKIHEQGLANQSSTLSNQPLLSPLTEMTLTETPTTPPVSDPYPNVHLRLVFS